MRSSQATWLLVAALAATTCIHTGCGFTRMGKSVGNVSMSRPRLMSWGKDKPDRELASTSPRPPSSSIPPAGTSPAAGSNSRSFPSEPAPQGNYSYASTSRGSGDYKRSMDSPSRGEYTKESLPAGDNYVAGGDSGAGSQRGFYDTEYQGAGGSSSVSSQYESTASRSSGSYDRDGAASSDYGRSYAGSGSRSGGSYEQVADRRGDSYQDTYDSSSFGGASQESASQYSQPSGDSSYGASNQGGSRFVSPSGSGGNFDDYRSPAQDSYTDNYDSGANYQSGADYSSGANYEGAYGGSSGTGSAGASTSISDGPTKRWLPGSTGGTTPYDQQQQLAPPTTNRW